MKTRLKKEASIALLAVVALYAIYRFIESGNFYGPIVILAISTIMLLALGACKVSGKSDQMIQKAINDKIERGNKK